MDEWTPNAVLAIVAIIGATGIVALLLTRGLIKAGQSPAPSMLVVSLSLLTLGALVGGLVFDSDSALALAGAGTGALAGAVSSVFTSQHRAPCQDPPRNDEEAP